MTAPPQAERATELLRFTLGENLLALYLYGSAVSGGLRVKSDIDLLAVVAAPTTPGIRRRLSRGLLAISGVAGSGPARPLEVTLVVLGDVQPWRHPPRCDFQYGEWLRDRFEKGDIPPPRLDPDLTILLHNARLASIALIGPAASDLFDPALSVDVARAIRELLPEVAAGWRGDERNTLLTLARMWVTLETGRMLPKDCAALRVVAALPPQYRPILRLAVEEYRGVRHIDWASVSDEVEAFVTAIAKVLAK